MGHVLLNPDYHAQPFVYRISNRCHSAYIASICWLSRNGRIDRFPRRECKTFGATPTVVRALTSEEMWLEVDDSYVVPTHVPSYGGRLVHVWKFGPAGTTRPKIPDALRLAVYERDGYACLHCGTNKLLTLDHIYPFSRGGEDTYDNLQTLCRSCNSKKGARV